jgi:hypothetical protein
MVRLLKLGRWHVAEGFEKTLVVVPGDHSSVANSTSVSPFQGPPTDLLRLEQADHRLQGVPYESSALPTDRSMPTFAVARCGPQLARTSSSKLQPAEKFKEPGRWHERCRAELFGGIRPYTVRTLGRRRYARQAIPGPPAGGLAIGRNTVEILARRLAFGASALRTGAHTLPETPARLPCPLKRVAAPPGPTGAGMASVLGADAGHPTLHPGIAPERRADW